MKTIFYSLCFLVFLFMNLSYADEQDCFASCQKYYQQCLHKGNWEGSRYCDGQYDQCIASCKAHAVVTPYEEQ